MDIQHKQDRPVIELVAEIISEWDRDRETPLEVAAQVLALLRRERVGEGVLE